MNKYKQLQQERASKLAKSKALLGSENPSAEDVTAADALNTEIAGIDKQLAIFEANFALERSAPVAAGITVHERIEDDPKRGFANVGDFALSIVGLYTPGGKVDPRLLIPGAAPTNYHKEGGSDEGRMVPPAFKDEIWEAVSESDESLIADVDSEPTASNSVNLNTDESTPWGASGVQASWRAEGAQLSASKLATTEVNVKLHELYAFVLATEELLEDAPRLNARLTKKAPMAIAYKINEAIVNGTGAGQPLGWFTSGAKVSVAKETSQTAATVNATNIAKMYARNRKPGQSNWYINQDVLPQLPLLTIGQQPAWAPPSQGLTGAPGGLLLGRPVKFLENCQTLGTQGDIQFVNPKGYYVAHKGTAPQFAESAHLFFDYNMRAFRWGFRIGGQLYLSAAVTPAKGSSTRSDVVVLDTRG